MNAPYPQTQDSVVKRIFWLYGLYTVLSNAVFLIGYYWLPEGLLRDSPPTAAGQVVASTSSFWGQFGLTLLFNLGWVTVVCVLLNVNQVRGFPVGYVYPISLAVMTGLIAGTNSFVASDLSSYNAREGMALGLSIGNLEMLGYICVIASTVKLGIYQYRSWWRWSGEWKPVKMMNFRDVRFSRTEILFLMVGVLLIVVGAYRETAMAFNLL
jgi:hypothetical protein